MVCLYNIYVCVGIAGVVRWIVPNLVVDFRFVG